jgi:hypothetical protein
LVPDEFDQVLRLQAFRTAHPEVVIGDGGFGTIQARIPEPNGEMVITRYRLAELLDKLDELTGEHCAREDDARTLQVLLELGRIRTSTPLSSQFRSTSYCCRTDQLAQRREFSVL